MTEKFLHRQTLTLEHNRKITKTNINFRHIHYSNSIFEINSVQDELQLEGATPI